MEDARPSREIWNQTIMMIMSDWHLATLENGIEITAGQDAIWICDGRMFVDECPTNLEPFTSRLGKLLPILIPQIIELDLASVDGQDIKIRYDDFSQFCHHDIDAFDELFHKSPFSLEVKTNGSLGFASNSYTVRFTIGGERVEPEVRGCVAKLASDYYLLDRKAFQLTSAAAAFNSLQDDSKKSDEAFRKFGEIKDLAMEADASVDLFMRNRTIISPRQIGVEIVEEENNRISFAPKIDGIANDNFQAAVKVTGSALPIYSFSGDGDEKISVLLNDDQKEAINRIKRVSHVGGVEKTIALRDPYAVFDGVMESVTLEGFGPRVRGIGDFPYVVQPFLQKGVTGIFNDVVHEEGKDNKDGNFGAGLICRYADGIEEVVEFESVQELNDFARRADEAYRQGTGQIEFRGKSIELSRDLIEGVRDLRDQFKQKNAPETDTNTGRFLLIYTNEDEIEFEQDAGEADFDSNLVLPSALEEDVVLKEHQRHGVAWLQHNFRLGRQGCLLADDMGLGKTLQLLIFLAWLIEQQDVISNQSNSDLPPWNPILVVAPLILIENETWLNDMRQFFKGAGAIFLPHLTLRGNELNKLKRAGGKETKLGEATLDLDALRRHRVIFTNYETVVNYQHSFAKMRDNWSVVVTDEAQAYKTPNTKVSHALKSLSPRFRVACTGTPVETRIFDIWNIFDFLQPGKLLGSAKEFCANYERPLEEFEESRSALGSLKERLCFGKRNAFILRRDKQSLTDLPAKHIQRLDCNLSDFQYEYHMDLLRRAGKGGDGNHPFALISEFLRLYQHPSLVPQFSPQQPTAALNVCPKLQILMRELHVIRRRQEKALIFTRSLDMQQILVMVIQHEFGLPVSVVNGSTKRASNGTGGNPLDGDRTRKGIINRFRKSSGFDVLILSPDVAGMGLTLTEANHVFHYGRWWNPAKEAQATDRVYRIGQERDVQIYYLIAKDPLNRIVSFDQKLDLLLQRRLSLADDFLAPLPAEEDLHREFMADLLENQTPISGS